MVAECSIRGNRGCRSPALKANEERDEFLPRLPNKDIVVFVDFITVTIATLRWGNNSAFLTRTSTTPVLSLYRVAEELLPS